MNRVLIYSTEQLRLYDLLEMSKHPLVSEGYVTADLLGLGSSNVSAGFTPSYNSNLTMTFGTGRLYTLQVVDATIYGGTPGGLAADPTIIAQSAENPAQTLTFSTASLSSGQALYALVEVSYAQNDVIDASDPTSGLLTYLNPSDPTTPWIGPGNDGLTQPTTRAAQAVLTIKYGSPATSGAQVPPTPDVGSVPLYLVTLSYNQTSITSANVVVAGPSAAVNVPSNYPYAPFIAGLLNSHHSGTTGQAPQIKLTSEVQGTLPLGNLPTTATAGNLPTMQTYAGNPNGNVAGVANINFAFDTTNLILYVCTTTGNSADAVWTQAAWQSNGIPPAGLTAITGNQLVLFTSFGSSAPTITLPAFDGTIHQNVSIGAFPTAKIAVLSVNFTQTPSSTGSCILNVNIGASGTFIGLVPIFWEWDGISGHTYSQSFIMYVPLTPGPTPTFSFRGSLTNNTGTNVCTLIGFYQ
jgi:hypothetical protein